MESVQKHFDTWDLFYFDEKYFWTWKKEEKKEDKNILITEQNMNLISQATIYENYIQLA